MRKTSTSIVLIIIYLLLNELPFLCSVKTTWITCNTRILKKLKFIPNYRSWMTRGKRSILNEVRVNKVWGPLAYNPVGLVRDSTAVEEWANNNNIKKRRKKGTQLFPNVIIDRGKTIIEFWSRFELSRSPSRVRPARRTIVAVAVKK